MLPNVLPVEASHSSLDLFERPPDLITFDTSFEQKVGPHYTPNGATLVFEVVGDRTNFIEFQNIYLEVKCKNLQSDSNTLRFTTADAAASDLPIFVNNTLHSLFSDCSVSANGIKTSSSNGNYAQKAFIETAFSHDREAKNTWLKCQGHSYEKSPNTFTDVVFTERQNETKRSARVKFIGKVAADIFSCEKHLISGVTLHASFFQKSSRFLFDL